MSPGDIVSVTACTDTTFNVGDPSLTMGPAALPGTSPTGLSVVYSNPGTANATSSGCRLSNYQGWPRNIEFSHNTIIGDTTSQAPTDSAAAIHRTFSQNYTIKDSIFHGGGWTSTFAEGDFTETRFWDANTLVANHLVFPTRSKTNYKEYPGAVSPTCTSPGVPGGCVGTFYFPVTADDILFKVTFGQNLADWRDPRNDEEATVRFTKLPEFQDAGWANQSQEGESQRGPSFNFSIEIEEVFGQAAGFTSLSTAPPAPVLPPGDTNVGVQLRTLIGVVDGVNNVFTTPTQPPPGHFLMQGRN